MVSEKGKKTFRYSGTCKLPSCGRTFKTNRKWQEFCPKDPDKERGCQQEWHRLLKKKHEDIIVEIEILKEAYKKMAQEIEGIRLRLNIE